MFLKAQSPILNNQSLVFYLTLSLDLTPHFHLVAIALPLKDNLGIDIMFATSSDTFLTLHN